MTRNNQPLGSDSMAYTKQYWVFAAKDYDNRKK